MVRYGQETSNKLCAKCGFTSNNGPKFLRHMKNHSEVRPYKCEDCGKGCKTTQAFREHQRIHTGERPFKCPTCGKSFINTHSLNMHMKAKHSLKLKYEAEGEEQAKVVARAPEVKAAETVKAESVHPMDAAAAMAVWRAHIAAQPELFKPGQPLNLAYLSAAYLDPVTRVRVVTEVKKVLVGMRGPGDRDGSHYVYTLHDPSLTRVPLQHLARRVGEHTRFQLFLASLFYIGFGKDERDASHLTKQATRNPKKMDRIDEIQRRGGEVLVHRWARGVNRVQGRYVEALALRATRLAGNLTNLKEEKPRGAEGETPELHRLMGTVVLWEAARSFGQGEVARGGAMLQCGLCIEKATPTVYRAQERQSIENHQHLEHSVPITAVRAFRVAEEQELAPALGLTLGELGAGNRAWLEERAGGGGEVGRAEPASRGGSHKRKGDPYTQEEEWRIVDYILDRELLERRDWSVGGNNVWRVMEEQGVLPARSWQSCKERFRRVILRKVARGEYKYPFTQEQLDLLDQLRDFNTLRDNLENLGPSERWPSRRGENRKNILHTNTIKVQLKKEG